MNNRIFEKKMGYRFKNRELLDRALTHSSFLRERPKGTLRNNERLEFLGDAFLDAIISNRLFKEMEGLDEGRLTKTRAQIVCEKSLAKIGRKNLDIGVYLNMGKGEDMLGGRNRDSIIADSVEALIGAVFLDSGYENTEKFVLRIFEKTIEDALAGKLFTDYKTKLQETVQKNGSGKKLHYILDKTTGPDHKKQFFVHVECEGRQLGKGQGKNKKEAEQQAAKAALRILIKH